MVDSKEYSLKDLETQLLNVFQQQQSVMLSNMLSYIAIDRLAYNVGPNTRFELSPDFKKLTITEVEPAPEDTGIVDTPPAKDKK